MEASDSPRDKDALAIDTLVIEFEALPTQLVESLENVEGISTQVFRGKGFDGEVELTLIITFGAIAIRSLVRMLELYLDQGKVGAFQWKGARIENTSPEVVRELMAQILSQDPEDVAAPALSSGDMLSWGSQDTSDALHGKRLDSASGLPDLLLEIRLVGNTHEYLSYRLSSPSGKLNVSIQFSSPKLQRSIEDFKALFLNEISGLDRLESVDGDILEPQDALPRLEKLGRLLYVELFPESFGDIYKKILDQRAESLLILTEEPSIPWELVRPHDVVADTDFWCDTFQLCRWMIGGARAAVWPPAYLSVTSMMCLEASSGMPQDAASCDALRDIARARGIAVVPGPASARSLPSLLAEQDIDLVHFGGHGRKTHGLPSSLPVGFPDGSHLLPMDLEDPAIYKRTRRNAPLVVFNACGTAQAEWVLTRHGGWPEAWVGSCGAGVFVGTQWPIATKVASAFAITFYQRLLEKCTLGEAVSAARQAAREAWPGSSGWLAYAVYGNPSAHVDFYGR